MTKKTRTATSVVSRWLEKKAELYAGQRCPRQYHQPSVPQMLKQKKD